MIDGRPLYPNGHHPVTLDQSLDYTTIVYPLPRTGRKVKYYFIDFDLSKHFKDDESPLALGTFGRFKAPELSETVPYNAFMVDVWILGRTYERDLLEVHMNALLKSSGLSISSPEIS